MNNGLLQKGYVREAAHYCKEVDEYADNPFIEALPPMKESYEQRNASIGNVPKFTDEDKSRSIIRRKAKLLRWADEICIPFSWHDNVAETIEILIRSPYVGWSRDDFAKKQITMNEQLKRLFKKTKEESGKEDSSGRVDLIKPSKCYLLTGLPGVGKTTVVNRILKDYPNCIDHSETDWCNGEVKQIPFIRITCPHPQGFRKALYSRILTEIDLSLGVKPKVYSNMNIDDLQQKTRQKLSNHFVGLVVLEEFTNIFRENPKRNSNTIDTFITDFFNTLPCSALLVGGKTKANLFANEAFSTRRAVKAGEIEVPICESGDEDWIRFCQKVWDSMQITRTYTPYEDEIHGLMSSLTQRLPFLFVELYIDAQILAMKEAEENGTPEIIKPEHIAEAARTTKRRIVEKVSVIEKAAGKEVLNSPDLFSGKLVSSKKDRQGPIAEKDQLDKNAKIRKIVDQYKLLDFDRLYCPVSELREIAKEYYEQHGKNQTIEEMLTGALRFFKEKIEKFNSSLPDVEVDDSDLDDFVV